jgi:hypothetical protein
VIVRLDAQAQFLGNVGLGHVSTKRV